MCVGSTNLLLSGQVGPTSLQVEILSYLHPLLLLGQVITSLLGQVGPTFVLVKIYSYLNPLHLLVLVIVFL